MITNDSSRAAEATQLPDPDRPGLQIDYESQRWSIAELCARYNTTPNRIRRQREREGWIRAGVPATPVQLVRRMFVVLQNQLSALENDSAPSSEKKTVALAGLARTLEKLTALEAKTRRGKEKGQKPAVAKLTLEKLRKKIADRLLEIEGGQ